MKLYPLIYINEGARTSEEAVSKGVAAFITKKDSIVLFVVERVIDITKRFVEKYPSNARKSYHNEMLGTELAKRSIVAEITTTSVGDDLYKVESSAGVSKFGPLAYQLAMVNIYPSWLISDVSLTEDGAEAKNLKSKSDLIRDIREVIRNELSRFKSMTTASSQDVLKEQAQKDNKVISRKMDNDIDVSNQIAEQQGREMSAYNPKRECPANMDEYIRKDSIPCWGCSLDY